MSCRRRVSASSTRRRCARNTPRAPAALPPCDLPVGPFHAVCDSRRLPPRTWSFRRVYLHGVVPPEGLPPVSSLSHGSVTPEGLPHGVLPPEGQPPRSWPLPRRCPTEVVPPTERLPPEPLPPQQECPLPLTRHS